MTTGTPLTRSDLLRRAAVMGGAAVAIGASGGLLAATASAAPREEDLAWLRFAIAAEFVAAEFNRRARRGGTFRGGELRTLERQTAATLAHRRRFTEALQAAGQTPIEDADLEVSFPTGAFASRRSTVTLGRRITGMLVPAYLGAAVTAEDADIRRLFAQVSASKAQALAFLAGLDGTAPVTAFPSVHGLDTASDELARFLP